MRGTLDRLAGCGLDGICDMVNLDRSAGIQVDHHSALLVIASPCPVDIDQSNPDSLNLFFESLERELHSPFNQFA
jgi:hypothetical protein